MSLFDDVKTTLQSVLNSSNIRLVFRQGYAADWALANPVLLSGEPGYELDTRKEKRGNGVLAWNDLPYASVLGTSIPAIPTLPADATDLASAIALTNAMKTCLKNLGLAL